MRVLIVSRYKSDFADHRLPFVTEQGSALREQGCEVDYFLIRGSYLYAVSALKQRIRDFKPDIIHAHYGLSAITAELQSQVPVVTTFHNGEWHSHWVNFCSSLMSLRAKYVIYVAEHIRSKVFFKHKHYAILPCGVTMADMSIIEQQQARAVLGWGKEKKYILFGGAFDNLRKGYPLLQAALQTMNSDNIEVIEMKGLRRQDCVLRMCAADCFILPSQNEGSPQALKEAMSCNCPIVATDIADVKHLLGDLEGHFLLSNPCGTPTGWKGNAQSINELATLLQQALAFDRRTNGRERIKQLGLTNTTIAASLIKIYKKVLNR